MIKWQRNANTKLKNRLDKTKIISQSLRKYHLFAIFVMSNNNTNINVYHANCHPASEPSVSHHSG